MGMWTTEVSRKTTATAEKIWSVWTDVMYWSDWDADIVSSVLSGEFEPGATGIIKPKSGPQTTFSIIEATPRKSFTNRTKLPLCKIDFIHEMSPFRDGTIITHRIEITGLLSSLFVRLIGKTQEKNLPLTVESLVKIVEENKRL